MLEKIVNTPYEARRAPWEERKEAKYESTVLLTYTAVLLGFSIILTGGDPRIMAEAFYHYLFPKEIRQEIPQEYIPRIEDGERYYPDIPSDLQEPYSQINKE